MSSESERVWYFHYRDQNNAPRVTVCIIHDGRNYHRGVAICSLKDNPFKRYGRALALKRARRAQSGYKTFLTVFRKEAMEVMKACNWIAPKLWKSNPCCLLTEHERSVIERSERTRPRYFKWAEYVQSEPNVGRTCAAEAEVGA